jgi:hypothetical protein
VAAAETTAEAAETTAEAAETELAVDDAPTTGAPAGDDA